MFVVWPLVCIESGGDDCGGQVWHVQRSSNFEFPLLVVSPSFFPRGIVSKQMICLLGSQWNIQKVKLETMNSKHFDITFTCNKSYRSIRSMYPLIF